MSSSKILVLGGTGPAGICLLRELLHRNHTVVAYARNPSKIPKDLSSNTSLNIVKGEMNDAKTFSRALSGCSAVISHLGAQFRDTHIAPSLYADMYRNTVIPAMREHRVRRIFLMGTMVIPQPDDSWAFMALFVTTYMKLFAGNVYRNILNVKHLFESEAQGLDWTIFRIAAIPGGADEKSWQEGREEGKLYVGPVGANGWTMNTNRSLLARWLVDATESGAPEWIRKMPAVTRLVGS
jgi:putative NADH-flavin reductase